MNRVKKKRTVKSKKRRTTAKKTPLFRFDAKKWLSSILLVCFLLFTILVAGYVVFFQTVLAEEEVKTRQHSIVFEEPFAPVAIEIVKKITTPHTRRPSVAIIIDDMGYDNQLGNQFIELDMNLSFSFLPFAPFTQELDEIGYKAGRTILLHLPLQPKSKDWDPGPGALYLDQDKTHVKELFEKSLNSVPHATGVNNHMGSRYTEDVEAMTALMKMIKKKELFYVDSFTTAKSVGERLAAEQGVKTARRHVFLDNSLNEDDICKQIDRLVEIAQQQGYGIGIGHPHQVTLTALSKCMKKLSLQTKLVSVTELLH